MPRHNPVNAPLYYECHITLEPVRLIYDQGRLESICADYDFKVAKLFMESGARSTLDSFTTGRSKDYNDIFDRMTRLSIQLRSHGFKLIKRKIEAILLSEYEHKEKSE